MTETANKQSPTFSTQELSGLKKEVLNEGEIIRIKGNSLDQILFVADRICQTLGLAPGEGRKSLMELVNQIGYYSADIRPQGVFGVRLERKRIDMDNSPETQYEYSVVADNRNAKGVKQYTDQLNEAVNKSLDPDTFKPNH